MLIRDDSISKLISLSKGLIDVYLDLAFYIIILNLIATPYMIHGN